MLVICVLRMFWDGGRGVVDVVDVCIDGIVEMRMLLFLFGFYWGWYSVLIGVG